MTLAVAEQKFEFEHRDLHWGNVVITPTEEEFIKFVLKGKSYEIKSEGVRATIIDYSLSRMTYEGAVLYNDLENDPKLFGGTPDFLYAIYRFMRKIVE